MNTYTYSIQIYRLENEQAVPACVLTGEVEAERYSHACTRAWEKINTVCNEYKRAHECQTAVGDLLVRRADGYAIA